ncbi:cytochrome P450 [Amycolatopsis sp. PS_44_ISF1]|uniref:cytochrome P450 n=1 Tax=Amycolatopsis sp. PS_44_ISF1 TaxID=2974917 RepID=UPI0028DEC301|nr:cytochrome P450 [Amycolatopsis sp. PS_44_ISF1]MDT8909770.1 cytochrome P450 [Amycolatopsis sp. PS_44_ISF1]
MTATEKAGTRVGAFPQDRTCPYEPPAGYREVAGAGPISRVALYDGREVWAISGHAEARRLLADPRLSTDRRNPAFPATTEAIGRVRTRFTPPLVGVDDPVHKVQRGMLISSFTHRRISDLRPRIRETAERVLGSLIATGAPADLVTAFAQPLPSMVMCHLLGVPYEDHDYFEERTTRMLSGENPAIAMGELRTYLLDLAGPNRHRLNEGLFGDLVSAPEGEVGREDLVDLTIVILGAGFETTASMLSLGIFTLLDNPERLAELRADPALWPAAAEELLRYLAITDGITRVATEDIEVAGRTIGKDDGIIFLTSVLNRHDEVRDRPDVLDWHRPTRNHVAFGFGAHQCLGQNLARAILEIALQSLFERLPDLRLATAAAEIPFKPGAAVQGLVQLPVTW